MSPLATSNTGRTSGFVPLSAEAVPSPYLAIVSSHVNPYLSGVAKFNRLLAARLGVPCLPLDAAPHEGPVLVSVKLSDADSVQLATAEACVRALDRRKVPYDVFLHSFDGLECERRLVRRCRRAYAGNGELADGMARLGRRTEALWCPALVDTRTAFGDEGFAIFSFGMSHKIQIEPYTLLKDILDAATIPAELLVSTAFHEKASFGEIDTIERRFSSVFGDRVHLLGFLSDASVNHFLRGCDLFCAFFPGGVRANNTTVAAAMDAGAPVLTNLDAYSPEWMRHGQTVLDVERLRPSDLDPDSLHAIAEAGRFASGTMAAWEPLLRRLCEAPGEPPAKRADDAEERGAIATAGVPSPAR